MVDGLIDLEGRRSKKVGVAIEGGAATHL